MASNAMKAVYACRRQVHGLEEEETWRSFLQNLTGKRSLREMEEKELRAVISELRRSGAAPHNKAADKPYIRKVYAIWSDMCRAGIPENPTREGLRGFVYRMTSVDDPNWMSLAEAQKVTEALKAWRTRDLQKKKDVKKGDAK